MKIPSQTATQNRTRRTGIASSAFLASSGRRTFERRNGRAIEVKGRAFFLHRVRGKFLCKLSLRQTLRHRPTAMSYLRFRDEDESSVAGTVTSVLLGALAGFAVGMVVAQKVGGFRGLAEKLRRGKTTAADDTA